jgi:hypothetical protein
VEHRRHAGDDRLRIIDLIEAGEAGAVRELVAEHLVHAQRNPKPSTGESAIDRYSCATSPVRGEQTLRPVHCGDAPTKVSGRRYLGTNVGHKSDDLTRICRAAKTPIDSKEKRSGQETRIADPSSRVRPLLDAIICLVFFSDERSQIVHEISLTPAHQRSLTRRE